MLLTDHIALDAKTPGVKTTREGFLVAEPRVARTGIQTYTAGELGLTDRAASDVIRVYRPAEEVFATDALRSFAAIDLTIDHPKTMVDSKNWKDLAVGNTGESVLRDGEFMRLPIILKDQSAIDAYQAGKAELSVGYTCELVMEDGKTPTGDAYDARQTNIRANHLALCDRARGGSLLRIGDNQGDSAVTLKTITFDGLQVADVSPAAEAVILKLQSQLADAQTAVGKLTADLTTANTTIQTKDGEIAGLNIKLKDAEVTPARLQELADARAKVITDAKKIAGETLPTDGLTVDQIKKAAVAAKLGDAAKDMADAAIEGAFTALIPAADGGADPVRQIIGDGGLHAPDAEKPVLDAYNKMVADLKAGGVAGTA